LPSALYFLGYGEMVPGSLVTALVFGGVNIFYTARRYDKLERLAMDLDGVLHGETAVDFSRYDEGELSILKNQLDKVVLRLREQSDDLKAEKIHLTDSIADISHQLKTPMTSINLIINFLENENLTQERRISFANDLQKLSDRIDWLINALLKMSKIDAGTAEFKSEKVYVKTLLQKAVTPLEIPMDLRNQQLIIHQNGQEYFTGDLSWTVEAFTNVLKNCSEHTPGGGKITISCEQTAVYTEIVISDDGTGIEKDDLPNIFSRFYKGKNSSADSVGIGLALARMIIVNQKGTIKAENNPDGGAKFTIKMYHTTL
ncbi:MAG: HAMP domain-containing sensor histidine kinase, partial [Oscillospiraceae bacterium]